MSNIYESSFGNEQFYHRREHTPFNLENNSIKEWTDSIKPVANYFVKALLYIKRILDFLIKAKPLVEQYGPVVKELPKLYKLMRLMQSEEQNEPEIQEEVSLDEEQLYNNRNQEHESTVKLFI